MEAQIPGGPAVVFETTYQEQIPGAQYVIEGDNSGTQGNQQSRYYMAC